MPQNLMGRIFEKMNEEILSENPEFDAFSHHHLEDLSRAAGERVLDSVLDRRPSDRPTKPRL